MRKLLLILILLAGHNCLYSQQRVVDAIFSNALSSDVAYENLRVLCETTEGRISGSPEAAAAVEFTRQIMTGMDLDTVYLQEVMVPNWKRGEPEIARIVSSKYGNTQLNVIALGLSVGTGPDGVSAPVVEVSNIQELEELGEEGVRDKIVFFNRKPNHAHYNTFDVYSDLVGLRFRGPAAAASFGAVAAIVRSATTAGHDYPHTGVTRYEVGGRNIPSVAVSPAGAEVLRRQLAGDSGLSIYLRTTPYRRPDVLSYNVIGEIWGSELPGQIITVGGHLDSWDNSPGAHDDGAGCMQSIDVLRIFREEGIRPKRTIRAVMFMDEEISQRGGNKYADLAYLNGEEHYFAIESDRGAFTPRGFSVDASPEKLKALQSLLPYFTPWGMHEIFAGGSGVDIAPLKNYYDMALAGLITDTQRYFDLHHSANDTFDQVNRREMQLGSGAMAAIIYLVDYLDILGPGQ